MNYLEIQSRFTQFGAAIVGLSIQLKQAGVPSPLVDQLFRSATSVSSNFSEARGAESRSDFAHKLQAALKECRETKNWLETFQYLPDVPRQTIAILLKECDEFCAILFTSVRKVKGVPFGTSHTARRQTAE